MTATAAYQDPFACLGSHNGIADLPDGPAVRVLGPRDRGKDLRGRNAMTYRTAAWPD